MKNIIFLMLALLFTSSCIFAQSKAGKKDVATKTIYYSCPKHADVLSSQPGKCPICGMDLTLSKKEKMKADVTKRYTCPTHLDVTSSKQGVCPKCGNTLTLSNKEKMKSDVMKYSCTMHSEVASKKSGNCPKCGMLMTKVK